MKFNGKINLSLFSAVLALAPAALTLSAAADQCAYLPKDQAVAAEKFIRPGDIVLDYCEPCNGSAEQKPLPVAVTVKSVKSFDVGSGGYWGLNINDKKSNWEPLHSEDLAYLFLKIGNSDQYLNLSKLVGCESNDVSTMIHSNGAEYMPQVVTGKVKTAIDGYTGNKGVFPKGVFTPFKTPVRMKDAHYDIVPTRFAEIAKEMIVRSGTVQNINNQLGVLEEVTADDIEIVLHLPISGIASLKIRGVLVDLNDYLIQTGPETMTSLSALVGLYEFLD